MDIFLMGDAALRHLDRLELLIENHACAVSEIYEECIKTKLHILKHIVVSMRQHKRCLTCSETERKHKMSKGAASFTYRLLSKSLIARDLHNFLRAIMGPNSFEATYLRDPVKVVPGALGLFKDWGEVLEVCTSTSLSSPSGCFRRKDMLLWRCDSELSVGQVELFLRVKFHNAPVQHVAFVQRLVHVAGAVWSNQHLIPMLLQTTSILRSCSYQRDCNLHVMMLPTVF